MSITMEQKILDGDTSGIQYGIISWRLNYTICGHQNLSI